MDANIEIWKPIEGFEGFYEISNFGKIKSLKKRIGRGKGYLIPERRMVLIAHTNGYEVVWLRKIGLHRKFYVHVLVAKHFLEEIEGKDQVNHKDKDRFHNHVRNLEYMNQAENTYHRDNYKRPMAEVAAASDDSDDINPDDIPF